MKHGKQCSLIVALAALACLVLPNIASAAVLEGKVNHQPVPVGQKIEIVGKNFTFLAGGGRSCEKLNLIMTVTRNNILEGSEILSSKEKPFQERCLGAQRSFAINAVKNVLMKFPSAKYGSATTSWEEINETYYGNCAYKILPSPIFFAPRSTEFEFQKAKSVVTPTSCEQSQFSGFFYLRSGAELLVLN